MLSCDWTACIHSCILIATASTSSKLYRMTESMLSADRADCLAIGYCSYSTNNSVFFFPVCKSGDYSISKASTHRLHTFCNEFLFAWNPPVLQNTHSSKIKSLKFRFYCSYEKFLFENNQLCSSPYQPSKCSRNHYFDTCWKGFLLWWKIVA